MPYTHAVNLFAESFTYFTKMAFHTDFMMSVNSVQVIHTVC